MEDVTRLLQDWRKGDKAALDALTPIVYQELRRLAGSSMRAERPGHTLQPTALIHEAYLRLIDQQLPVAAGYRLAWSADGSEIAVAGSDPRILRVTVPAGAR